MVSSKPALSPQDLARATEITVKLGKTAAEQMDSPKPPTPPRATGK
jgi:hypothetical protein